MSDKVKERIEKEALLLAEKHYTNSYYQEGIYDGYVSGAEAERSKAWNEAIDACTKYLLEMGDAFNGKFLSEQLQHLKHKQP